jgi:anti-sigma-K factor RskA
MTLDERLIAYVDGELSGDELKRFEAEMAANPRLAGEVEKHRTMAARLAAAYAPVIEEKVPGRLKAAARAKTAARPQVGVWQWAAMAASLIVGVVAGVGGGRFAWPEQGPLVTRDGTLVANGALKAALTNQLGSQDGPVRAGLSFKTANGRYCRTFQSAEDQLAGVACRQSDGWVMQTTTVYRPAATPAYRTAASQIPAAVLSAVDGLIAGPPLEGPAERAARDRGWK